jgi:hypothetical protein
MTYTVGGAILINNYSMHCYFPYELECCAVRHDAAERHELTSQTIAVSTHASFLLSRYAIRDHDLLGNRE